MSSDDKGTWTTEGENILSEHNLALVKQHLESIGNIVVEHWHYFGGRSPTPLAFDDFDEFNEYLRQHVRAGDAIDVFPFPSDVSAAITRGKFPDGEGRVPKGGAY